MPGAVRFTLACGEGSAGSDVAGVQGVSMGTDRPLELALEEALAGIECSWLDGPGRGVLTLWASREDAGRVRGALAGLSSLPSTAGGPCRVVAEAEEEERDFVEEAAALRRPVAVGPLLLDPHEDGARATPAGKRLRLVLPAARAFGTGSHESTRLALRLLAREALVGRRVLDAGCGNGVLSLAARLLGARRALGFDVDPDAAVTARAEAHRNGVVDAAFFAGAVRALGAPGRFDVAVANMLQEEVAPLLADLARLLVRGGTLITSGQLLEREGEFDALLASAGFRPYRRAAEGEWCAAASCVP